MQHYEHIFYERRLDRTTSLFCRDLGTRWLTTRSEGHSNGWAKGLGKKPRSPNLANR